MSRPARAAAVALALAAILAPRAAAGAGPPPGGGSEDERKAAAKGWFEKGALHHKVGEYEPAIEAYKEAYKLRSDPVYLYNIAVAARQAGDYASAARYYELYLSDDPESPLRGEIEPLLVDLRRLAKESEATRKTPPTGPVEEHALTGAAGAAAVGGTEATRPGTAGTGVSPAATAPAATAPRRGGGPWVWIALGGGAAAVVGVVVAVAVVAARGSLGAFIGRYEGEVVDFRP